MSKHQGLRENSLNKKRKEDKEVKRKEFVPPKHSYNIEQQNTSKYNKRGESLRTKGSNSPPGSST